MSRMALIREQALLGRTLYRSLAVDPMWWIRLGAFCVWGCVVAGLTWGLGGWAGVMFSLRMGIGGRNLVGGGLRNEFFSHRYENIDLRRACAHTGMGPGGTESGPRHFFAQGR